MRASLHPFASKPGRHGTLYRFRIVYRDKWDPASPDFDWYTWAYDVSHAEERFYDSDDDEGWKVLSVERTRDTSRFRDRRDRRRRRRR